MDRSDLQVPEAEYERLSAELASDESPVGIDAKKAHIIILHKLMEIEARLARIERELQISDRYNI